MIKELKIMMEGGYEYVGFRLEKSWPFQTYTVSPDMETYIILKNDYTDKKSTKIRNRILKRRSDRTKEIK